MSKPPNLNMVETSVTSPSKTPAAAVETPSGLGTYGVISRPRFLTNQITSPTTVTPKVAKPSRNSFRYRPSRPSLGYIFDNNHRAPSISDSNNKKKDKKSKSKSKSKSKNKQTREEFERINNIRQSRKQSTLASFSQTPNNQAFDAIKKELEFLKREVPNFESKYSSCLATFHSTSHSKSRQIEYAFIQALSQWIIEDGAPAVKELTEFKQDVQHEMTGLVSTCEELSKQNQQLTIVISDLQEQNNEINKAYSEASKELNKLNIEKQDTEIEEEVQHIKEDDFKDLSQDLEQSQEQNQLFREKIKRLESYLKQAQKDNDDLSNKEFAMENDLQQSKAEVAKLHAKIASLEQQHEHELMILAKTHEDYRSQMESEQQQLIQIAEESQKQVQQMAANIGKPRSGTVVTPMFEYDDYNANAPLAEENKGGGTTLDAEFSQYPFSEDEWLEDSDEQLAEEVESPLPQLDAVILDSNSINIEPVKEPTPPPFDAEFETVKESVSKTPLDPTKTFKMEKEKTGVEMQDVTQYFSNEKQSYSVETKDITQEFSMEHQETINDTKEKDVTMEFESVKESNIVETVDIASQWRVEKSVMLDVAPDNPEERFVSERQEFGVSPRDPTKDFTIESKSYDLERADLSNTFSMETRKAESIEKKEEPEFVMEKQSASLAVHHKEPSLELQFSKTDLSYTPKTSDADQKFETGRMSIDQPKEAPRPQYAYQIRHLRMDVDAAPPRITKIRKPPPTAHDRPDFGKYYDGKDEIIRKSLAFQKIMSKWKKDEVEKGGKPEILRQREYELVNKWNMDEKQKLLTKTKAPTNRQKRVDSNLTSPASPSFEIFSMPNNSGNFNQIPTQKITKTRMHKLKPKLQGVMKIIYSKFVPKYQLKKELSFFFCLDGLPSLTNLDKNESEKDRKGDFLVPALFFFENENGFKQLEREVGKLAVRNAFFQKAFSRLCKGIITLHTHACDSSLEKAIVRLETMKGRQTTLKKENDTKEFTGQSLYIVNERDFHRFEFENEDVRDEWLHKINKLIQKRTSSVQRAAETYRGSHKQSLGLGTPIQRASRASSKIARVKDIENAFD